MTFVGCKHFVEKDIFHWATLFMSLVSPLQLGKLREITMEMPVNARFHLLVVQNAFFLVASGQQ